MDVGSVEEVASSKSRLLIAALISTRPRTLRELAMLAGMSAPGVLKHLSKLMDLGLVEEAPFEGAYLGARKIYRLRGYPLKDFSAEGFIVVKESRVSAEQPSPEDTAMELESLSTDLILQRRRAKEQVRRLGKAIDRVAETEARLNSQIERLDLTDIEKLLVRSAFTEESVDEAVATLQREYGLPDARTALDRALEKVRRVGST